MRNTVLIIVVGALLLVGGYWFFTSRTADMQTTGLEEDGTDVMVTEESMARMEPGVYRADTDTSTITWQAGKPAIAGYVHTGTFRIEGGEINLIDENLTGEFVIDMNSLKVTSLGGGNAGAESTLEGHLKGERFFDVETYPTATFRVTEVSPKVLPSPTQTEYTAKGDLTMNGQTHSVEFPMRVVVSETGTVTITSALEIDRTVWGIDFGSSSIADKITDQIIGDMVTINLMMELDKQ